MSTDQARLRGRMTSGNDHLVVFAPSLGRGPRDFARTASLLKNDGFLVECPAPRGFTSSAVATPQLTARPQLTYTPQLTYSDWADDLARVITQSGFDNAVVVGHAAGSRYARTLAAEHPHLVRGLVLAAAASSSVPVPAHLARALEDSADESLGRNRRLDALQMAFFAPGHDASEWLTGWSAETHRLQRATAAASNWAAVGENVPIFDLQGQLDPWRPDCTRNELVQTYGARVTVSVIADASHALFDEQPEATARSLSEWIAALPD